MAVGDFVEAAFKAYADGKVEVAFSQASIAVDATAKKEAGVGGRKSYKSFLNANLEVVTRMAFGTGITGALHLGYAPGSAHPDLPLQPDGTCQLSDILYHVVRCGLLHEAALHESLKFSPERMIYWQDRALVLPHSLVHGLLIAVVLSPSNADEVACEHHLLNFLDLGFALPLNTVWGQRDHILWLFRVREKAIRLPPAGDGTNG